MYSYEVQTAGSTGVKDTASVRKHCPRINSCPNEKDLEYALYTYWCIIITGTEVVVLHWALMVVSACDLYILIGLLYYNYYIIIMIIYDNLCTVNKNIYYIYMCCICINHTHSAQK